MLYFMVFGAIVLLLLALFEGFKGRLDSKYFVGHIAQSVLHLWVGKSRLILIREHMAKKDIPRLINALGAINFQRLKRGLQK